MTTMSNPNTEHGERVRQIRERRNALELRHGDWPCQTVHKSRERAFQQYVLADMDHLLSLLDSQASELAEEKRLRAELKQIARIGIQEVSSVGTRLQECAVRDATEHAATRMRDLCIAKIREIHEQRLRDLRALTEQGEVEQEEADYERTVLFVLSNVIDALKSLTLEQGEQEKSK